MSTADCRRRVLAAYPTAKLRISCKHNRDKRKQFSIAVPQPPKSMLAKPQDELLCSWQWSADAAWDMADRVISSRKPADGEAR